MSGTDRPDVLWPPASLGVIGGGQLGRMFVHAAQRMGYCTAVLDPDPASPAGLVSHHHIQTDYLDQEGLARLAQVSAAITTEFENVPELAMRALADRRPVSPSAQALGIAQDRVREKSHFAACGVACAPYAAICTTAHLSAAGEHLFPGLLKTARMGYDGKGQQRVADRTQLAAAWSAMRGVPCVLEKELALLDECSVIVARGWDSVMVNFPVQRNQHRAGILAVTEVFDSNLDPALCAQAVDAARSIARGLDYVGVLCVEFFVVAAEGSGSPAKQLLVNEIAPRPHNSGHYTLDACDLSQFDLQVRTLAGLPLVQPRQHSAAVMRNLLGDLWFGAGGAVTPPDWAGVLALPGTHLHLYGKLEPRPGRKMGHLTIVGVSAEAVRPIARRADALLGLASA